MDSVYFEYLEGDERTAFIEEASLNNEFDRLSTLFEMTELRHQQSIRDAQLKVLVESGTYDDLDYLLEAEAAETGEQKQGILAKILDVIASIFSSIHTTITNFFSNKVEPDKMVEVENKTIQDHEFIKKIQGTWNAVESNFKAGNYAEAAKAAAKIVLPAAAAAAGGAAATAAVVTGVKQMKAQDVATMVKDAETLSDKINVLVGFAKSVVGKIAENVSGEAKKVFDKIKAIGSWIKTHITELISKITGVVNDAKDKAVNAVNDAKEKAKAKASKNANTTQESAGDDGDEGESDNGSESAKETVSTESTDDNGPELDGEGEGNAEVTEGAEISTEESIFGAVLEESVKEFSEKQDVFEEELNDLRSMFSEFDGLDD